ncbi:protein kinase [Nonomuraea sp. NPDC050310]|uniref:protein kinase domain-containing protein n=1 Tax=Nonomuraea sp. NPDC050310 TaxID=3154935 RepID=UPI0033FBA62B
MPDLSPLGPGDPQAVGRYRLLGVLGRGGQGTVYLGEAPGGQRVAVKIPHMPDTLDQEWRPRLARELDLARRTAPAFTARIVEADLEAAPPYIVSEYIDGPSLRRVVDSRGPLDPDAVHRLAAGLATALAAIHREGVVHRDVKPDNVLMGPDGPRLIDFGIARVPGGTMTATGAVLGTPRYMAPELFEGERVGAPADVWAWGATVCFAATGREAFGTGELAAIMRRVLTAEPDLAGVAEPLRPVVAAALAKRAADRPTSVELLLRLLGSNEETTVRPAARRRRWPLAAVAGALAVSVAAGGGWLVLRGTGTPAAGPQTGAGVAGRPVTGEPVTGEPVTGEPVTGEPAAGQPGSGEPAAARRGSGNEPGGQAKDPVTESDARDDPTPAEIASGPVRAYFHVSAAEHGRRGERLRAAGFRPVSISVTGRGYTALWRKGGGPKLVMAQNLTGKQYQAFWDRWTARGYAETITAAYGPPLAARFATVMEEVGSRHQSYFGLTLSGLRRRHQEAVEAGYALRSLTAYGTPAAVRYSATWLPDETGEETTLLTGMTREQHQSQFDRRAGSSEPALVIVGPDDRYAALYRPRRADYRSRTRIDAAQLAETLAAFAKEGFALQRLHALEVRGKVTYTVLGRKAAG